MTYATITSQGINILKHNNERKESLGPIVWTTSGEYGVFWSIIGYPVSDYRRVLILYIGQILATSRVRDNYFNIRRDI